MVNHVLSYLKGLGPLRWMLCGSVIFIMLMRPVSGTEVVYEGWAVFPTLLFPALAPILFMVLMLDAIMSKLLMTSKLGDERIRLQRAVWTDLIIAGLSVLVWFSYYSHLLTP